MYIPESFREDRVPVLHDAMRRIGFATLVTLGGDGLTASHIPLLIDPDPAPYGTVRGHVARANGQWRDLSPEVPALAVFLGVQGYVSPSWYPTKAKTGKVVPTWNYVAVHAYGPLRVIEDPQRLLDIVTRLTERHEAGSERPWRVTDAPEAFVQGMLRAIVGFEMPIERLEGKWKLSQNRPDEDRQGVVEGLTRKGREADLALADAVRAASRPATTRD
jgi:transcriptional regulator